MKKILILVGLFITVFGYSQRASVLVSRGDTVETVENTGWFYLWDAKYGETKMVRLNDIYGSGGSGTGDVSWGTLTGAQPLAFGTNGGDLDSETSLTYNGGSILNFTMPSSDVYLFMSNDGGANSSSIYTSLDNFIIQGHNDLSFIADDVAFIQADRIAFGASPKTNSSFNINMDITSGRDRYCNRCSC